jgi:hypothetical protein
MENYEKKTNYNRLVVFDNSRIRSNPNLPVSTNDVNVVWKYWIPGITHGIDSLCGMKTERNI